MEQNKLKVGAKVRMIGTTEGPSQAIGMVGIIRQVYEAGKISASFYMNIQQYQNLSIWRNGARGTDKDGRACVVCTWTLRPKDYELHEKVLSDTERRLKDELTSKKDRSPVEEFILFGLEDDPASE